MNNIFTRLVDWVNKHMLLMESRINTLLFFISSPYFYKRTKKKINQIYGLLQRKGYYVKKYTHGFIPLTGYFGILIEFDEAVDSLPKVPEYFTYKKKSQEHNTTLYVGIFHEWSRIDIYRNVLSLYFYARMLPKVGSKEYYEKLDLEEQEARHAE